MDSDRLHSQLIKHVPAIAIPYCFQLWQENPFVLKLRNNRISKVGDFTWRNGQPPRISINQDSHPYLFLLTYVHEVAHLVVHHKFGRKHAAHGAEWKATFRELMSPLMNEETFPHNLLVALRTHMAQPKASSFSDTDLTHALRACDERQKSVNFLSEIPEGSIFGLHGRWFKKGKLKRTRVLCCELKTKRNYLVHVDSVIDTAQLALPIT